MHKYTSMSDLVDDESEHDTTPFSRKLVAYGVYCTVSLALTVVIMFSAHPLGEGVATSGILSALLIFVPGLFVLGSYWQIPLVAFGATAWLWAQNQLAYGHLGHDSASRLEQPWLFLSPLLIIAVANLAAWIVRRFIWQGFRLFSPSF